MFSTDHDEGAECTGHEQGHAYEAVHMNKVILQKYKYQLVTTIESISHYDSASKSKTK